MRGWMAILLAASFTLFSSDSALAASEAHAADPHMASSHAAESGDHGGGEAHHGPSFGLSVIFQGVNFLILAGIIFFAARKGVKSYFYQRSQGIREALEAAQAAQREAEAKSEALQERLARLDGEVNAILTETKNLAESEQKKILEKAKEQAQRIADDAQRQIGQEVEEARARILETLANESLTLVENLLSKELNDSDRSKLFEDFLGEIERLPQGGSATGAS